MRLGGGISAGGNGLGRLSTPGGGAAGGVAAPPPWHGAHQPSGGGGNGSGSERRNAQRMLFDASPLPPAASSAAGDGASTSAAGANAGDGLGAGSGTGGSDTGPQPSPLHARVGKPLSIQLPPPARLPAATFLGSVNAAAAPSALADAPVTVSSSAVDGSGHGSGQPVAEGAESPHSASGATAAGGATGIHSASATNGAADETGASRTSHDGSTSHTGATGGGAAASASAAGAGARHGGTLDEMLECSSVNVLERYRACRVPAPGETFTFAFRDLYTVRFTRPVPPPPLLALLMSPPGSPTAVTARGPGPGAARAAAGSPNGAATFNTNANANGGVGLGNRAGVTAGSLPASPQGGFGSGRPEPAVLRQPAPAPSDVVAYSEAELAVNLELWTVAAACRALSLDTLLTL